MSRIGYEATANRHALFDRIDHGRWTCNCYLCRQARLNGYTPRARGRYTGRIRHMGRVKK